MRRDTDRNSRRAFFTRGGAALGAGLAATAAGSTLASAVPPPEPVAHPKLSELADREAIRQLQLAFARHMESGRYEDAVSLFGSDATLALGGETASGRSAIGALLARYGSQEVPVLHRTYRQSASQQQRDTVTAGEDGRVTARFHVDIELCVPLQGDCTAAHMARMQGGFAQVRWVPGRIEVACVKAAGQWQLASLSCLTD
jgi:hypothetical protein